MPILMIDRYSQFGVDVHVKSDAVNHSVWNGKKADDIDARKKGLHVIPILYSSSLFLLD
jgi:hypothetical protein